MRKRMILILVVLLCGTSSLFAEKFRLGAVGGIELFDSPVNMIAEKNFNDNFEVYPGLYWEVVPGNLGFGMTYLGKFDRQATTLPGLDYQWHFNWIGTFDFRYHFIKDSLLDPFIEAGIGNAGRVDITAYGPGYENEQDDLIISNFGQAGGGLAFNLKDFHVGAKVLVRFLNRPLPATQFDAYPLKNFNLSIFGGASF
jgi:hypothetical protein